MKITLLSDLHLESGRFDGLSGGDVLLLAGDTCEVGNLYRFTSFVEEISEKFRFIYVIAGNHEHYQQIFSETIKNMKGFYASWKNIYILNNNATILAEDCGTILYGTTLWTNFNGRDFSSMEECKQSMNDFYEISYNKNGIIQTLQPSMILDEYDQSLQTLKGWLDDFPHHNFVVMTHHAPTQQSIHQQFKQFTELNGGFCNHLEQFILDHPQIKYWVHGHVHNSFDYMIGNCRVMCNPRGYGKENKFFFNKDFSFEV